MKVLRARPLKVMAVIGSLTAVIPTAASAQEDPITLSLFRGRSPGGTTVVDAVTEIDPRVLRANGACDYILEINIFDVDNTIVAHNQEQRSVRCTEDADTTVRLIDTFSFGILRGRHIVELAVTPAEGARRVVRESVEPLSLGALASDLILAAEVSWDTAGTADWPVRRGELGIRAEAVMDVPTSRPLLAYYLEVYPGPTGRGAGTVSGVIQRPDGRRITGFTLQQLEGVTEIRPVAGTISLAGLPVGTYDFVATVEFGSARVERTTRFRMVREAARVAAAEPRQGGPIFEYFNGLADDELARFDAIVMWMESEEQRGTYLGLTTTGKRAFLADFFSRVVPPGVEGEPGGPEALRTFLARMTDVEREFGPARADAAAPWRTDAGRLWLQRGAPDDRIRRPFPGNNSKPYEIWYYSVGNGYVYLFVDETGFNNYRLLYTTDPAIPTLPGWQARAGYAAVNELMTLYGIRAPRADP